ncbi:prosaposin isoform X2 [Hypanus sabinus]|uniref:prosaposin isoform X2 n=1 Tax=Hypanus sabinus TaxID=79690 RepID=UPI0028C4B119|nr:prosaposin isoform X2 [Hypanus sabinus]
MAALLIAVLCFGAAVAKPFSGQERCAEGPPFWCQDVKTASECGAVKHCQQNVWRQPTVKSAPCDLCKDVMSVLGDLLKDNTTESEVRSYLAKACGMIPDADMRTRCNELVDDYLPIILDILNEELENPEVICTALHLCQTLQATLNGKDITSNEIPEVDMSKIVSPFIANVPLLLYPQQTAKPKVNYLQSSDNVCLNCNQFISNIQTTMKENVEFQNELITHLKKQCNVGPGLTELCEKYIALNGPQVAEVLIQRSAEEICTAAGFCDKAITVPMQVLQEPIVHPVQKNEVLEAGSAGCVICEFVMQEVKKLLQENTTEEAITDTLIKVCSVLPDTVKSECEDFISEYGKAVEELLLQELDPVVVCRTIGLCKHAERTALGSQKAKPKQLQSGALCEICKTVVQKLDSLLEEKSTEEEIKAALDEVCTLLPKSIQDECDNLVAEYEPLLIQVLLQSLDPDFVCKSIGACTDAKQHLLGANECVWGPSYWCKNMETANQCNAVEHCKRHIWN